MVLKLLLLKQSLFYVGKKTGNFKLRNINKTHYEISFLGKIKLKQVNMLKHIIKFLITKN